MKEAVIGYFHWIEFFFTHRIAIFHIRKPKHKECFVCL